MSFGRDIEAGKAYVELMLRDKKFLAGLKAAGKRLAGFAKAAAKAGAAAAAAAAAGIALATKQFAAMGSHVDRMAKRIGMSVESLSALEHAANKTGAPIDRLHEGLAELVQRLGEAATTGTGTAAEQLERLGLSAKELQKLAPEDALARIVDEVAKLPNKSDQLFAFDELLGGDSRELLGLLSQGSAGIKVLTDEAKELGLVMSGEAAAGATRLQNAFSTLVSQIKMIVFEIGHAFMPVFETVLPIVQDFAKSIITAIRSSTATIKAGWEAVWNFTAPIMGAVWQTVKATFFGIVDIVKAALEGVQFYSEAVFGKISVDVGSSMAYIQKTIITALGTISFAFKEWRAIAAKALVAVELGVVKFGNQVKYFFGEFAPEWIRRTGMAFVELGKMFATILQNMFKNFTKFLQALSEGKVTIDWTPLLEGYESAMADLDPVAAREMSPLEKKLTRELNELNRQISEKFQDHMEDFAENSYNMFPRAGETTLSDPKRPNLQLPGGDFNLPDLKSAKDEIFSTFSAAAAAAQGRGGKSDGEKVVDKLDKVQQQNKKLLEKLTMVVRDSQLKLA